MQFTNISIAFFSVVALTMVAPGPAYADDQMRGYLAPRSPAPEDGLRGQRMASEYTVSLSVEPVIQELLGSIPRY